MYHYCLSPASLLLMCEWTVFCLEGTVECFTAASVMPHYFSCVSGQSSVWRELECITTASLLFHYFLCVSGQSSVWREPQCFTTASLLLMCEWTVFCLERT